MPFDPTNPFADTIDELKKKYLDGNPEISGGGATAPTNTSTLAQPESPQIQIQDSVSRTQISPQAPPSSNLDDMVDGLKSKYLSPQVPQAQAGELPPAPQEVFQSKPGGGFGERIVRSVASGALGTAEGIGGALQWISGGKFGKDFADFMRDYREQVSVEDPNFAEQLASGLGSMVTFFIPGMGVGSGVNALAKFSPKAAQWLGAGTMAVTEAATEAGQVYRDSLQKDGSKEKAEKAARLTFLLNLPVLALSDKLAFFGNEGKALHRALRAMVTEGAQEMGQEVVSNWALGDEIKLGDVLEAGAVGAILGGGFGALSKPLTKAKLSDNVDQRKEEVSNFIAEANKQNQDVWAVAPDGTTFKLDDPQMLPMVISGELPVQYVFREAGLPVDATLQPEVFPRDPYPWENALEGEKKPELTGLPGAEDQRLLPGSEQAGEGFTVKPPSDWQLPPATSTSDAISDAVSASGESSKESENQLSVEDMVARISAYKGGEFSPIRVGMLQELGKQVVPGVRLQDAEESGRLYLALQEGTVNIREWNDYVEDLYNSNKAKRPEVKTAPTISTADAVDDAIVPDQKPDTPVKLTSSFDTQGGKLIPPADMKLEPASKAPGSLPTINDFPREALELAPDVFQHKRGANAETGETGTLGDIQAWDESKAGKLTVFRTADNRYIVANGHQRFGAASRLQVETLPVQIYDERDGWNVKDVRAAAAWENIAGGSLDALDVAMVVREVGATETDLISRGISMRRKDTKNGIGLANLSEPIWDAVYSGRFDEDLGAAIGNGMAGNPAAQEALFKFLKEREAEGKPVSKSQLEGMIRMGKTAMAVESQQTDLFGSSTIRESRLMEKAELADFKLRELKEDKRIFGAVDRNKLRLNEAGNVIDPTTNKEISGDAAKALVVFDKAMDMADTEVNRVLNEYSVRLAKAKTKGAQDAVKREVSKALDDAIRADYRTFFGKELGGSPTGNNQGKESQAGADVKQSGKSRAGAKGPLGEKKKAKVERSPEAAEYIRKMGAADRRAYAKAYEQWILNGRKGKMPRPPSGKSARFTAGIQAKLDEYYSPPPTQEEVNQILEETGYDRPTPFGKVRERVAPVQPPAPAPQVDIAKLLDAQRRADRRKAEAAKGNFIDIRERVHKGEPHLSKVFDFRSEEFPRQYKWSNKFEAFYEGRPAGVGVLDHYMGSIFQARDKVIQAPEFAQRKLENLMNKYFDTYDAMMRGEAADLDSYVEKLGDIFEQIQGIYDSIEAKARDRVEDKPDLKQLLKEIKEKREAWSKEALEKLQNVKGAELKLKENDMDGWTYLLHPSTYPKSRGQWQLTKLWKGEPWGHSVHKNLDSVIEDLGMLGGYSGKLEVSRVIGEQVKQEALGKRKVAAEEPAFELTAPKQRTTAFQRKINEVKKFYPELKDADVARIIKVMPEANPDQVALMVADKSLFSKVANGNVAASERGKLFANAKQEQLSMFGGTLFDRFSASKGDAVSSAAKTLRSAKPKPITTALLQEIFGPKAKVTQRQKWFEVELPNGKKLTVNPDASMTFNKTTYDKTYGGEVTENLGVIGRFVFTQDGGMILVAAGQGLHVLHHETFHAACALSLTLMEQLALLKKYGGWEEAAFAYEEWQPGQKATAENPERTIFQKIFDWFRNMLSKLLPNPDEVFAKIRSGEVWGREKVGIGEIPDIHEIKYALKHPFGLGVKERVEKASPRSVMSFDEIKHGEPVVLRAWHGTSAYAAQKIREGGFVLPVSEKNPLNEKIQGKFAKRQDADREGFLGRGGYFTDSKYSVANYGSPQAVEITLKKPYVMTSGTIEDMRQLDLEDLKAKGFDGIVVLRGKYGQNGESYRQGVVFDPASIKITDDPFVATTLQIGAKVINRETGETGTVRQVRDLEEQHKQYHPKGVNSILEVRWNGKKGVSKPRTDFNVYDTDVELKQSGVIKERYSVARLSADEQQVLQDWDTEVLAPSAEKTSFWKKAKDWAGIKQSVSDLANQLKTEVVDRYWPVERRAIQLAKEGKVVPKGIQPTHTLGFLRGQIEVAKQALEDKVYHHVWQYDSTLGLSIPVEDAPKFMGEGLIPRLKPIDKLAERLGIERQEVMHDLFDRLMIAQRDLELAGELGNRPEGEIVGVRPEKSKAVMNLLAKKYGRDYSALTVVAESIRDWTDTAIMQKLLQAGIISQERYNEIKESNQYYIPYKRLMDDLEGYISGEMQGGRGILKAIKGSERQILDPLQMLIDMAYKANFAYANNLVRLSLAGIGKIQGQGTDIYEVAPKLIKALGEKKGVAVSPLPPEPGTISFYKDGKLMWLKLPPDMFHVMKFSTPTEAGMLMRFAAKFAEVLKTGAILTPEFAFARNPVRDAIQAWLFSSFGFNPLKTFTHVLPGLIGKDPKMMKYMEEARAGGGFLSTLAQSFVEEKKLDSAEIRGEKHGFVKYFKNPLGALRYATAYLENLTRLSVYTQAREKGLSHAEAVHQMRRMTLDFNRSGAHPTVRWLNMLIPFWNASVQGVDTLATNLTQAEHKGKVWKRLGVMATASMLAYMWASGDDRYKELADWERNYFWHIPLGPGHPILRIPKPFEAGIMFGSVPERLLEGYVTGEWKGVKSALKAAQDVTTPEIFPAIFRPLIEGWANYSFFQGKPIEDLSMQQLPYQLRVKPWTSETAKWFSRNIAPVFSPLVEISPVKMEYFVRAMSGGLGANYLLPGIDWAARKTGMLDDIPQPDQDLIQKIWGVRAFFAQEPTGYKAKSVSDFFDRYQKVVQGDQGWKLLWKSGQKDRVEEFWADHPEAIYAKVARKIMADMNTIRNLREAIVRDTNLSSAQKKDQLADLDERILKRMQFANAVMDSKVAEEIGMPKKKVNTPEELYLLATEPISKAYNNLVKNESNLLGMGDGERKSYLLHEYEKEINAYSLPQKQGGIFGTPKGRVKIEDMDLSKPIDMEALLSKHDDEIKELLKSPKSLLPKLSLGKPKLF